MKGLNTPSNVLVFRQNQLPTAGFVTSGVKIKSKSLKSQRQTSVIEQEQTKKASHMGGFFVSKSGFALSDVKLN